MKNFHVMNELLALHDRLELNDVSSLHRIFELLNLAPVRGVTRRYFHVLYNDIEMLHVPVTGVYGLNTLLEFYLFALSGCAKDDQMLWKSF